MKVRLVKKKTVLNYAIVHARSQSSFRIWLAGIKFADWYSPGDMLETFGTSDLLGKGSNRIVFDVGGNNYRVICKYWFGITRVHLYVKWIGTHTEYDELCKHNLQYTIKDF
jgi:mRNA interferase HigB